MQQGKASMWYDYALLNSRLLHKEKFNTNEC